jgi:hypothetical protein
METFSVDFEERETVLHMNTWVDIFGIARSEAVVAVIVLDERGEVYIPL